MWDTNFLVVFRVLTVSWSLTSQRTVSVEVVCSSKMVDCIWNVMAHAQKPDFVFRRNRQVHLNQRGCQFSWLLVAEVCASAVVMLDTPCSEVVCRVLATHSILQFPLHFPSRVSPCAITFQLECTHLPGDGTISLDGRPWSETALLWRPQVFCSISFSSYDQNSVFLSFYWNYKELISYKVSGRVL